MTDFSTPEPVPAVEVAAPAVSEPVAVDEAPVAPASPVLVVAPVGGRVVVLPSGFRVAIRNPKAVRNRERKQILAGMTGDESKAIEAGFDVLSNILRLLIVGWDVRSVNDALVPYGDVLPVPSVDPKGLEDLPIEDANALDDVAEEVQRILFPNFAPSGDPASPTSPSAA